MSIFPIVSNGLKKTPFWQQTLMGVQCILGTPIFSPDVVQWAQFYNVLDSHTTPGTHLRNWHCQKKNSFLSKIILIHDFQKKNNLFHLNSIHCRHRHQCYNYRHRSTMKTEVLASVRNSRRTLHLTAEKRSLLSKFDSWFLVNTIIHSIITLFTSFFLIILFTLYTLHYNYSILTLQNLQFTTQY